MAKEIKLYSLEELSEMFGITRRTIYSWIKDGKLKAVKFGKYWKVSQENLEDFIAVGTGKKKADN